MLRGWFAQPSQDAELLRERHDTISFFVDPANAMYCAQLLPQLQTLLSKTKDVGNVQASFARGGLLLADYINAMSTAMCAVKVRGGPDAGDTLQPDSSILQPYAPILQP